jgi:F0F1-type ATP synthase delta subunit
MKVPRGELVPILIKLSDKLPAKKFSTGAASYLLENNLTGELDSLTRDMIDYRAKDGVVEVTAVSAHTLSDTAINNVTSQVKRLYPKARRIIVNQQIDQDQIGGVRLELPGQQLDLSVRGKLNQLKQLTAVS